jgi:hypothetical protein
VVRYGKGGDTNDHAARAKAVKLCRLGWGPRRKTNKPRNQG